VDGQREISRGNEGKERREHLGIGKGRKMKEGRSESTDVKKRAGKKKRRAGTVGTENGERQNFEVTAEN